MRNQADLDAFLEEFSALAYKKTIKQIYRISTDEAYGFLYGKLAERDINNMFWASLKKKFKIKN